MTAVAGTARVGLPVTAAFCNALREHGEALAARPDRAAGQTWKGEYDIVSSADLYSERVLGDLLEEHFPDDGAVGEEGLRRPSASGASWLVDPLDGTMNYVLGDALWGLSLARKVGGHVQDAVLFFPEMAVLATASRGDGAFLDGKRLLPPMQEPGPGQAILATKFGLDSTTRGEHCRLMERALGFLGDVRRSGCTSWDILQVARGVWHGYFGRDVRTWDVAASGLLLSEVGGFIWHADSADADRYATFVAGLPKTSALLRELVPEISR